VLCLVHKKNTKKLAMVQQNGCLLIGNLLSIPSLRKSVVDQGGLKAVVYALEKYPQDAPLQLDGCGALDFLLSIEFSWVKAAADSGCIELVVSAMNKHPDDATIQINGCNFLASISSAHADCRNTVIQAKGVASVAEALRIHSGNEQVKIATRRALTAVVRV
jgi:hypothetical protein